MSSQFLQEVAVRNGVKDLTKLKGIETLSLSLIC